MCGYTSLIWPNSERKVEAASSVTDRVKWADDFVSYLNRTNRNGVTADFVISANIVRFSKESI